MVSSSSKILVTGADGFIGSHLTETLVTQGYNVRAFTLYNSFNSWGWLDHSPKEILALPTEAPRSLLGAWPEESG